MAFATPTKLAGASVSKHGRLFVAKYNALASSVSPTPIGSAARLEQGQWYWCPDSKNIFEYERTSGGYKEGKVIFDMDLDPGETAEETGGLEASRAEPGSKYRQKKTKSERYHFVDQDAWRKEPAIPSFAERFPALCRAIGTSSMTVAQLRSRVNGSPTTPLRTDLVESLLVTAAKRHTHEAKRGYVGLEALEELLVSDSRRLLRAASPQAEVEWADLVAAFGAAEEKSPAGVAEAPGLGRQALDDIAQHISFESRVEEVEEKEGEEEKKKIRAARQREKADERLAKQMAADHDRAVRAKTQRIQDEEEAARQREADERRARQIAADHDRAVRAEAQRIQDEEEAARQQIAPENAHSRPIDSPVPSQPHAHLGIFGVLSYFAAMAKTTATHITLFVFFSAALSWWLN